jgi:hypothetical protein
MTRRAAVESSIHESNIREVLLETYAANDRAAEIDRIKPRAVSASR